MSELPPCKYGAACTRKNPAHFAEFSHHDGAAAPAAASCNYLAGKTACFSGGLAGMVRRVCKEKAEALGAHVVDGVNKTTDILFVGNAPGSKLVKAQELGVEVLDEEDFKAILEGTFRTKGKAPPPAPAAPAPAPPPAPVEEEPVVAPHPAKKSKKNDGTPMVKPLAVPPLPMHHKQAQPVPKQQPSDIEPVAPPAPGPTPNGKPRCMYGHSCYRKNPKHFEEYYHSPPRHEATAEPQPVARDATDENHSGSDTDVMDETECITPDEVAPHKAAAVAESVAEPVAVPAADAGPEPLHPMESGQLVDIHSTTTSTVYQIKRVADHYYCTCQAWKNQNAPVDARTCKHLREYLGDAFERWRLGPNAADSRRPLVRASDKDVPRLLLAFRWDHKEVPTGWWLSEKLDGVRAYWNGKEFISRLGNAFLAPAWFVEGLPSDITLDGELWGGRGKFQQTVSIVKTANSSHWPEVRYQVFDAPELKLPFEQRMETIRKRFAKDKPKYATLVEQTLCKGPQHLQEMLDQVTQGGGEGLMLRKPGSIYVAGRSNTLLKVKVFHDAEAKVVGYEPGKGKHQGRVGALHVTLPNGKRFKVGTGLSDRERENPPAVGEFVTFSYQELTPDGIPRFPAFVRVRKDMDERAFTAQALLAADRPSSPRE
eukprot:TRINITY_DN4674_c0_g1_i1.p1 TRINITY_DN4674_c0_g1~~TRINITY_DN4674_c0_g1_i1.p1  ORF type:complete len:654 (+),score=153.97 TRINITY_DN4674_c0_g1_i1:118-2079(+)